ncbi:enoyl-CoA hydratase/isomerase family protein [Neobacillus terrae]|uniref:enoyl-CoA hydratase/isomerase family protein n=1 Tax=Neobacillus terrae TaxID=3034837 RepID=UPI00140A3CC1|nr:enoyl-CoA hydratase-related protein [Neobacillus terrae]NHM29238.1 3-hydroxybutyryl-CoA dehydrogenase [Neobacillus terrae]
MANNCIFKIQDKVATISINRPPMNALNRETLLELESILKDAEKNENIRVLVLTGTGEKMFSAGADISEFGEMADRERAKINIQRIHEFFNRIELFPKPVIACVNGKAFGGGNELQMACHLAIAADSAEFALPEVRLGIMPGYGGTQRLPMLIGKRRALELMISGERISAQKALEYGLINKVAPQEKLIEETLEWARQIADGPPLALSGILDSVNRGIDLPINQGIGIEIENMATVSASQDAIEGVTAFFTKRKAEFKGK